MRILLTRAYYALKKRQFKSIKLILLILLISPSLLAQVTITVKNQSIRQALKEIQRLSHYQFFYNDDLTSLDKIVSFTAKDESIESVMGKLLEGTNITYKQDNNNLIVLTIKGTSSKQSSNDQKIKGTVVDESKQPVIGANIVVEGTTNGTITDLDGNFSLQVPENAELRVSYIGYLDQKVKVGKNTALHIILKEDAQALDEVIVVGYGTMKKSDITGSVASVRLDDLKEGASTSVDQMLLGKSAGVNVVQSSGEPGGGFSVNIRGASSINGGVSPLYVIDGVPIDNSRPVSQGSIVGFSDSRSPRNPMSSINPADIESLEILKDASATAIYGSRGANGVILITTKSGKAEKMKVSYSGSIGIQSPSNKLNILSAADYKRVLNEIIDAGGDSEANRVGDIANGGIGTDWQNEVTQNNAITHEHQLSFSGGNSKTFYYTSFNYVNQEGIVKNTSFERLGARLNLKSDINDKLKIGMNVTGTYMKDHFVANGFGVNENAGVMYTAYNYDPTIAVKDEEGNYALSPILTLDNPVALDEGMTSYSDSYRFLASAFGEYYITKDLFLRLNLGTDFMNESRKNFVSSLTQQGGYYGGIGSNQNSEKSNYIVEGTANYSKTIKKHSFGALAGISYQRYVTSYLNNRAADFPNESLGAENLNLGNQETFRMQNSVTGNRLASYIGRANYSYDDRYLATVTFRADGSSRFGKNNKFGYFPSAALAWRISNESFLKGVDQLTSLKLRLGWGRTGNQEIGDYPALSTYQSAGSAIWDGKQVVGTGPAKIPNPDLKWETTDQTNLGLDFGVFNNRINGGIDYFWKKTTDMLLQLPVPQSTGYNSILSNIGRIDNKGLEIFLNTVNIDTRNFKWESNITFTSMRNKVKDLGGIDEIIIGAGYTHVEQVAIRKPGLPLNSYYGWEVAGVWQKDDDFSKMKEDYKPGDLKYVDQNNDGVINDADRVVLGDSFPDFQWSFGNTFTYKNFDLYVFFEGVQGVDMLNGNLIDSYFPINFRRNKFAEPYLNRWTPENPTNEYPSFVDPLKQGRKVVNSRTLSDASYVRLKTIRLSYTLPKFNSLIQSLQLYVTAENLITITDYVGLDPAINPNSNSNFRMDFNAYPSARTFIFGAKIDF
ncbi:TonB-dependent receptor [Parabacteroides sp. GYB001]|uniref:TonB-dependent receptor n=1 Tax=Parabacteroides leei TaxID=2939491 RepID=UPI002016ABD2|nr:TonB-dependent receptor [Parabacteroides leei]MCL3852881.1 TonB-dependent receptor [Parabacteroides leei]